MHSATQIIAQRAPPAIRTKPRWQPYYSIPPALPPRSPTATSLHTPTIHVPPPTTNYCPTTSAREQARPTPIPPTPTAQTPKDSSQRDNTKHKFAAGLIDQAVHILLEIWRPQDVPEIFKASAKGSTSANPLGNSAPTSKPHFPYPPAPTIQQSASATTEALLASKDSDNSNLLPMKTFVHEVLKRSRTSASILQAALCYLEAIRPRVPEILEEERRGIRAHYHPDSTILAATEEEIAQDAELTRLESLCDREHLPSTFPTADDIGMKTAHIAASDEMKTIRVVDCDDMDASMSSFNGSVSSILAEPSIDASSTGPPLPSPLLCPRRAFLASLILASKFFQDKCYSNRAWAKLSGLPPREIGRCERALGEALQWRLWVGKNPVAPQVAPSNPTSARPLVRSQTESNLITASSLDHGRPLLRPDQRPLRKASTLPCGGFTEKTITLDNSRPFTPYTVIDNSYASTETTAESAAGTSNNLLENSKRCYSPEKIVLEKSASTPSPDTPGLTYSPSSTDSSGDRTIQMSSYEDNMFPTFNASQAWLDLADGRCAPMSEVPFYFVGNCKDVGTNSGPVYSSTRIRPISIVSSEPGVYGAHLGSNCLWHADNGFIAFETASVH